MWGSVGKQQTLQPAVEPLNQQLDKLNAIKRDDGNTFETTTRFTADSGFNSEDNLAFMASSGFDTYIADTQFRSRNRRFKESKIYLTEKEKRRLKRRNGKSRLITSQDFHYDKHFQTCRFSSSWRACYSIVRWELRGRNCIVSSLSFGNT